METFWRSFGKKGRKTFSTIFCCVAVGVGAACTSSRDNPALEETAPVRVYRATPTVEQMNQQSSTVNRKINIEAQPHDAAMRPPGERTQRVLPNRQPLYVDTVSTRRPRPDTTRRE